MGLSRTIGGEASPSGTAGGETGPLGAAKESRDPVIWAHRLQIIRRSREVVALVEERRDAPMVVAVVKEVPKEEEVPTIGGVPRVEVVARVEELTIAPGEI